MLAGEKWVATVWIRERCDIAVLSPALLRSHTSDATEAAGAVGNLLLPLRVE